MACLPGRAHVTGDFSHYRIHGRIGQGGMGEVYAADDRTLNRKVAIKFLLAAEAADSDAVEGRQRLLHEARAAAHLDHPFICKVYEVGEHESRAFLAMEFVEGVTLQDRLASGPLNADTAARIGEEIADALQFAHQRGVVHRDLKPANVMLGPDGHAKVMDFGVAKQLAVPVAAADETVSASTFTTPGELTGTLAYMSPEQLRGEAVDPRSDVFAFGVLLHELLTGTHPFKRASMLETAHAILHEAPPDLQQEAPGAPPPLAHIVGRCLEKERDRRYQSLGDVRLDLEAARHSPTSAVPRRGRKRLRWISVAAAIVVIVGVAAVVQHVWPLRFLVSAPALAFQKRDWIIVADVNNLTGDPVFDKSLLLALEVAIGQSQYVNVYPASRVAATLQRMQRRVDRFDEAAAAEVAVREGVRGVLACDIAQLGNVYALTARLIDPKTRAPAMNESIRAQSKDGVLPALDDLATRVRRSLGESLAGLPAQARPLPQVTTSSLDALKLYSDSLQLQVRDHQASDSLLQQAIALDPDFALAHAELGRRYYLSSDRAVREEGERSLAKALQLTDRLSLRERLWIQAIVEDSRGNRTAAVAAYKTYLAQYPDDASAWFRMAWTQMATLGQADEAVSGFKEVLRLTPDDASAHVNLASAYSLRGDFEAAIPAYQKAFALEPSMLVGTYVNHEYGFTLIKANRPDDAEAAFERMTKEGEPADRAKGYRSLALLHMYRGRYASAVAPLRQAIVLNQTNGAAVSEFRDRMYLVTAFHARNQQRDTDAAWADTDRLIARLSLAPSWLWQPVQFLARRGQLRDAQRLFALMQKTAGKATADASVAHNTELDRAYVGLAQAEIELAAGRPARAVELLEPAHIILKEAALESLAAAYAASGRLADAIARYEEFVKARPLGLELQEKWFAAQVALGGLYERVNRPAGAQRLYAAFLERWKDGDSDLVLLETARTRLRLLEKSSR